ncbi:MAG: hypothetical protein IH840_05005 [Candidatus Heimdallarchaeota archaeon]|nr:hypothetical protein [Candidatus Heimdallarchaeota archaeon]
MVQFVDSPFENWFHSRTKLGSRFFENNSPDTLSFVETAFEVVGGWW